MMYFGIVLLRRYWYSVRGIWSKALEWNDWLIIKNNEVNPKYTVSEFENEDLKVAEKFDILYFGFWVLGFVFVVVDIYLSPVQAYNGSLCKTIQLNYLLL